MLNKKYNCICFFMLYIIVLTMYVYSYHKFQFKFAPPRWKCWLRLWSYYPIKLIMLPSSPIGENRKPLMIHSSETYGSDTHFAHIRDVRKKQSKCKLLSNIHIGSDSRELCTWRYKRNPSSNECITCA